MKQRTRRYFRLASRIAQMDGAALALLLGPDADVGPQRNAIARIDGAQVFVKRIPVTDVEYDNLFSTRNLYSLPTWYNYGIGSLGLGVFRELVTHIRATNWVLAGEIETFPLLYHYRIVPRTGARPAVDMARQARYVEYWGGNPNVDNYAMDRARAAHELVLFVEYIPYTVHSWLQTQPATVDHVLDDLRSTIDFLRRKGIIHFDAHFQNALTDGKQVFLTDFGLALDRSFDLTAEEAAFFKDHIYYDYGKVIASLESVIYADVEALAIEDNEDFSERFGLRDDMKPWERARVLLTDIERLHTGGFLNLDERLRGNLVKHRGVIGLMSQFYIELRGNPRKDTQLDHTRLRRHLRATGYV